MRTVCAAPTSGIRFAEIRRCRGIGIALLDGSRTGKPPAFFEDHCADDGLSGTKRFRKPFPSRPRLRIAAPLLKCFPPRPLPRCSPHAARKKASTTCFQAWPDPIDVIGAGFSGVALLSASSPRRSPPPRCGFWAAIVPAGDYSLPHPLRSRPRDRGSNSQFARSAAVSPPPAAARQSCDSGFCAGTRCGWSSGHSRAPRTENCCDRGRLICSVQERAVTCPAFLRLD